MKNPVLWFSTCMLWCVVIFADDVNGAYYGKSLGKLSEFHHGVSGHVYAVDGRTLFIKDFTYDGEGPAAFFYVGNTKAPSNNGAQRLRDERGSTGVLKRYRGKDITLTLPEGKTFHSIRWFSVWCDEFSVNFGDVKIPRNLDYPKPQKISGLSGVHGVSSDSIVIVDAQTLLIPNFSYDGEAPDAKFWAGRGDKPSSQGIRIPDENGRETPLRKYDHKTIVLTLPGDLTIFDIGHFGVWCEAFTVDFGHVKIPEVTNVPPSLKMLGVSPQSKLNCEVLYDDLAFEVRWAVAGESVVIQLVAKLEDGEYMSFGISGDENHSQMVGSDVTVAWVDKTTLKGYAYDYYLDAKSQCAGTRGSCPDERLAEKTNSVRLLNAAMVNGYSIVTYQRPLKAADDLDKAVRSDKPQPIVWAVGPLNSRQEVSYHSHFTKGDKLLDFGRAPAWNCPMPEMDDNTMDEFKSNKKPTNVNNGQYLIETSSVASNNRGQNKFPADYDSDISETNSYKDQTSKRVSRPVPTPKPVPKVDAWEIPPINCDEPEDGVFYAQMGPTGGKHGYPAITGHVGWGISWYINGLLIPEINVVRGKRYTFVVEGGFDENTPARYHPFYITDDSIGGYEHKTPEERAKVKIYAGVSQSRNGDIIPTGVGRLCNWTPDINGPGPDEFSSFGAYQRTLTLQCDQGEPGIVTWTPDRNTPDTVYYQCFTHRYLGWKINVLDSCDISGAESKKHEVYESPDDVEESAVSDDLLSHPSIRVNTRVKPDSVFIKDSNKIPPNKHLTNNLDNHNMDGRVIIREIGNKPISDMLSGETLDGKIHQGVKKEHDFPISKTQLMQVIDSVEKYESNFKNSQEDFSENHPVYYHSTTPSHREPFLKDDHHFPDRRGNEDVKNGNNNAGPSLSMVANQKPMTLQTFMRPHGKPMMSNNMFFRRPPTGDMRNRRPGMQKPLLGMPPKLPPPPPFMLGQSPFPNNMKKPIYKMPTMNRPPMNIPNRLPPMIPVKQLGSGSTLNPQFGMNQNHKAPPQPVILGKPNLMSQTLTLGQPTIIGQQVVKSQMSPPAITIDSSAQQTIVNSFLNKPGQIIMGKPMDNPLPLDQQMIQTKQHPQFATVHLPGNNVDLNNQKYDLVIPVFELETTPKTSISTADITPSELLNSSPNPNESLATMRPAINTGFKPDSVVIEGGFKPIIREPLLSGEDRIADYDSDSTVNNRRQDSDSKEETQEDSIPPPINDDFYEKQFTESFEPMFIPSPPDRHLGKNITITREKMKLFQYLNMRPQPVYRPELEELESKESNKEDTKITDDMVTAADRIDSFYLPPDNKKPILKLSAVELPPGTVVSYDGHTISEKTLTNQKNSANKLYSAKLSSNSEMLTKTPQYGPFRGEIPSLIQSQLSPGPITKLQAVTNSHSLPGSLADDEDKTKHVSIESDKDDDKSLLEDFAFDASGKDEVILSIDEDDDDQKKSLNRKRRGVENTRSNNNNTMDHDHSEHHDHGEHKSSSVVIKCSNWFYILPLFTSIFYA